MNTVIPGYIISILSLFVLPMILGVLGIILSIVNLCSAKTMGHGIAQLLISIGSMILAIIMSAKGLI